MEQGGQQIENPSLNFDFDHNSGNIKVNETPVALKNETQWNFIENTKL